MYRTLAILCFQCLDQRSQTRTNPLQNLKIIQYEEEEDDNCIDQCIYSFHSYVRVDVHIPYLDGNMIDIISCTPSKVVGVVCCILKFNPFDFPFIKSYVGVWLVSTSLKYHCICGWIQYRMYNYWPILFNWYMRNIGYFLDILNYRFPINDCRHLWPKSLKIPRIWIVLHDSSPRFQYWTTCWMHIFSNRHTFYYKIIL